MAGTGAERIAGVLQVLRNERPFAALRLRCACLRNSNYGDRALEAPDAVDVLALLAACPAHASLRELDMYDVPFDSAPALDALVDAAIRGRWERLRLARASVSSAALPSLARLLRAGCLTHLTITRAQAELFDGAAVPAFCAAVRASRLLELELCGVSAWSLQQESSAVLQALTGHATLRALSLHMNAMDDQPIVRLVLGGLMAALLSAESALVALDVSACALGDEGIAALAGGLAANTQLQSLKCEDNGATAAAVLLLVPAAHACTSLIWLSCDCDDDPDVAACVELVAERDRAERQ
jgi:hypothetical protein